MAQLAQLTAALGLDDAPCGEPDMRGLKAKLTDMGVNSCGWRLYLNHGDALFAPLLPWFRPLPRGQSVAQAVAWLRLLQACEMDVLPPLELARSVPAWGIPLGQIGDIPPLFLRAAWKATVAAPYNEANTTMSEFVAQEVVPLAQWFFRSGAFQTTNPARLKAGWESLQRLQSEETVERIREQLDGPWPALVYRYTSGPFVLRELCTEEELQEEGEAMSHCVGTYADTCRFEPVRVYSIRYKQTEARIATLSVRETRPGWWDVDQLKGPSNGDPGNLMWPEISDLLQLLNTVTRHNAVLRRHLDLVHQHVKFSSVN